MFLTTLQQQHNKRFHAQALRPDSVILMGKNTMMKRSIRLYCEEKGDDRWAPLLDELVGNVGLSELFLLPLRFFALSS